MIAQADLTPGSLEARKSCPARQELLHDSQPDRLLLREKTLNSDNEIVYIFKAISNMLSLDGAWQGDGKTVEAGVCDLVDRCAKMRGYLAPESFRLEEVLKK